MRSLQLNVSWQGGLTPLSISLRDLSANLSAFTPVETVVGRGFHDVRLFLKEGYNTGLSQSKPAKWKLDRDEVQGIIGLWLREALGSANVAGDDRIWFNFNGNNLADLIRIPWESALMSPGQDLCNIYPTFRRIPGVIAQSFESTNAIVCSYLYGHGFEPDHTVTPSEGMTVNYLAASSESLKRALQESDVVVFCGHGGNPADGDQHEGGNRQEGELLLDGNGGIGQVASLTSVIEEAGIVKTRLIVLAACCSLPVEGFCGVKTEHGVLGTVVVGTHYRVEKEAVKAFANGVIEALASDKKKTVQLTDVISFARKQVFNRRNSDDFEASLFAVYAPIFTDRNGHPTGDLELRSKAARQGSAKRSITRAPYQPPVWTTPDFTLEILSRKLSGPQDLRISKFTALDSDNPRSFTPVLGPGALQVGPHDESSAIGLESVEVSKAVVEALGEHWREVLRTAPGTGRTRWRAIDVVAEPANADSPVEDLRLAVASLIAALLDAVASRPAIKIATQGWDSAWLDAKWLRGAIESASRAAQEISQSGLAGQPEHAVRLLGASQISARLDRISSSDSITGSTITWLVDLLWHILIFDDSLLPRLEELSFQVSLLEENQEEGGPVRSLEPSRLIRRQSSMTDVPLALQSILVQRGAVVPPPNSPSAHLHRLIARILQAQHKANDSVAISDQGALGLSMNFGLDLEHALGENGGLFHVAMPIYASDENSERSEAQGPKERLLWIEGLFDPKNDECTWKEDGPTQYPRPWKGWRLLSDLGTEERPLEGPLVVKLNGSPMHSLEDMDLEHIENFLDTGRSVISSSEKDDRSWLNVQSETSESWKFAHAIGLGEFDLLQIARHTLYSWDIGPDGAADGFSAWANSQLRSDSRYWFLAGLRLDDWSTRERLHWLLGKPNGSVKSGTRGLVSSLDFDPDLLRFIDWSGLDRVAGDLKAMFESLESFANSLDRKYP